MNRDQRTHEHDASPNDAVAHSVNATISARTCSEPADAIDEVVVVGRLPGPPLWKVSSGDHALWIFPHVVIVPKKAGCTLITSTLDRFVRRNDLIRVTDVSVREIQTVEINELRQLVEAESGASLGEADIACFEQRGTFETSPPQALSYDLEPPEGGTAYSRRKEPLRA